MLSLLLLTISYQQMSTIYFSSIDYELAKKCQIYLSSQTGGSWFVESGGIIGVEARIEKKRAKKLAILFSQKHGLRISNGPDFTLKRQKQ